MKYIEGSSPRVLLRIPESLTIHTDPLRLRVILNNLLSNAIKYADPTKAELIITITAAREGNDFIFSIEDNGEGIPENQQDKIFEMFYRASEKASGSGLGLYIVKESLEKLNGSIQHQSKLGQGSKFTITIPLEGV